MATTETGNIYTALMAAQKEMGPLLKNATNPHFKSRYADLGQVIETITEPLHNNHVVWLQTPELDREFTQDYSRQHPVLRTVFHHIPSGTEIISNTKIVSKDPDNPQAMGAAITYARRYALVTMCGLAPEDDDGNLAARPRESVNNHTGEIAPPSNGRDMPARQWVPDASDRAATNARPNHNSPSEAQFKRLFAMQKQLGLSDEDVNGELYVAYGINDRAELNRTQYGEYTDELDRRIKNKSNRSVPDDPF